jgi:hypothetical protein
VTFGVGVVELAGVLAVPAGAGADRTVPGVVLVSGSGPSDRDNGGYFVPIRRAMVDAGVAVLSYDKRGVGLSTGSYLESSMDDLAADAEAAAAMLRTEPGVDARRVGLFGHSEGGWVVLRAAARHGEPPFVITNAGPGMSPAVQDRYAVQTLLRLGELGAAQADECLAVYDRIVELGRAGGSAGELAELLALPAGGPLVEYLGDADPAEWEFTKRTQDHDPWFDLLGLRCPLLAVFGGADPLVPVTDSVRILSAAACHPARRDRATVTVSVFPGADHRVQHDAGGRFAEGYLATVTRWIHAHS